MVLAQYGIIVLKLLVCMALILIYLRFSGKGQLAPLSPTDQVGNMAIGGMVGSFALNPTASFGNFIVLMVLWSGFLIGLRALKYHSARAKDIIDGKRIQLVRDGRFIPENFRKSHLSVRDFMTKMNQQKIASFDELKSVWYEQDGQITFIRNEDELLCPVVIEDGNVNDDQLEAIGKDESWLTAELAKQGVTDPADVFCADWHDDKLWIYRY